MCSLEPEVAAIRGYELRLIRCTLSPSPPSDPRNEGESLDGLINDLLNSIECGNYVEALTSQPSSTLVFQLGHDSPPLDTADRFYSELVDRAESFIRDASTNAAEKDRRVILVICIAVAAFLGFTQCNFTGPLKVAMLPRCPLPLDGGDEHVEWDNWARNQLMSAGSDLLGKFSNLQYIVFAKMLLMRMKDLSTEIRSLSWWLVRVLLLQQRILDERSSSLFDLLHVYMNEALQQFSTLEQVQSYWDAYLRDGESLAIVSMLHLEAGIMEYAYGRVDSCRMHFESAEMAAELQLSVTGVLGFRTVHQAEPKAQMVLVTNTSLSNDADSCPLMGTGIQTCDSNSGEDNWHLHQSETSEASDVLRIPKLLENVDDSNTRSKGMENIAQFTPSLTATQQAVILAYCLLIEKSSRHDELQRWDMAPYIEAIDSQHLFYFTIRCLCDILRIRWESSRGRTKERALLMMDNLDRSLGRMIGFGCESQGLYQLRKSHISSVVDSPLVVHAQLGHPSLANLKHLVPNFSRLSSLPCESCQLGKHVRSSFHSCVNSRASSPFVLVYSDVWVPSRAVSTLGSRYFVTFIDDFSQCNWVYLMK